MGVNSLPKTVTRQRRDCDFNPAPSAPESSTLTMHSATEPALTRIIIFIYEVETACGCQLVACPNWGTSQGHKQSCRPVTTTI